jgi:hypothetical protein
MYRLLKVLDYSQIIGALRFDKAHTFTRRPVLAGRRWSHANARILSRIRSGSEHFGANALAEGGSRIGHEEADDAFGVKGALRHYLSHLTRELSCRARMGSNQTIHS